MDLGGYLAKLIHAMRAAEPRVAAADIRLEADVTSVDIDRSVPVALIVHEALVNALKPAAPESGRARVLIGVRSEGGRTQIEVPDEGIGPPTETQGGAGSRIVDALARQRHDRIGPRHRARFVLRFAQMKPRVAANAALRSDRAADLAAVQTARRLGFPPESRVPQPLSSIVRLSRLGVGDRKDAGSPFELT